MFREALTGVYNLQPAPSLHEILTNVSTARPNLEISAVER